MKRFFFTLSSLFLSFFVFASVALGYATLGIKWGGFNPSYPPQVVGFKINTLTSKFYTPTVNAMNEWTNRGGAKFTYNINNNSSNDVTYENITWVGSEYALGATKVYDNGAGAIMFADIKINQRYDAKWSNNPTSTQYDIQNTVTHEFGHALGLSECPVAAATMYQAASAPGETWRRSIESDDMSGIQYLYGKK